MSALGGSAFPVPVTMLWESVEAGAALQRRFGFADAGRASAWVAGVLGEHWGIRVDTCERIVISSWSALAWVVAGERRLIAKWCAVPNRFRRLHDAAAVTSWLHQRGIPVAVPIAATDGRLLVDLRNDARGSRWSRLPLPLPGSRFLVGVLPVVDGELLDVTDPTQVAQAGAMLAAVHAAMADYPNAVDGRRPRAGQQLVHNDFRSANLLHDGHAITAVLDLEEIRYDTPMADLAKAAVMLGTQYRQWAPAPPDVRNRFIDSYSASVPLTSDDRRELEAGMTSVLAAKWWHD